MPTISDLKDQARALEQQGQIEKALNIYQHILKHLEGNPAITKVLPLYVKAGDLLLKMDRTDEAVASYQTGAEHYAKTGAATRVTALCEKIRRNAPERTDVYTSFVRLLIEHGHVGSARDVLAEYAQISNMDRALETLNDLAGRPNHEVQPMLERLLESFELEEQDDQTAERVSTHLEHVTDDLAGELTGVPEDEKLPTETTEEEEETDEGDTLAQEAGEDDEDTPAEEDAFEETEPLTPQLLDLDSMPRQSRIERAITDDDLDEMLEEEEKVAEEEAVEEEVEGEKDVLEIEQSPSAEITTDVTPTMESTPTITDEAEEAQSEGDEGVEEPAEDGGLNLLLSESMTSEDAANAADAEEAEDTGDTEGTVEIERSQWTPDFAEPSAEETVAAEWSPEEELQPAARYPSDEYETPAGVDETTEQDDDAIAESEESAALDDEIARAIEDSEAFETAATEPDLPTEQDDDADSAAAESAGAEPAAEVVTPLVEADVEPEPARRPSRPPRVMLPDETETKSKSPVLFGVGGFVVGLLVGAGLSFVFFGGGGPVTAEPEEQQVAVETTPPAQQTPVAPQTEVQGAQPATPDPVEPEAAAVQAPDEPPVDSSEAAVTDEATLTTPEVAAADTTTDPTTETPAEQPAEEGAVTGNPIIVEGMNIDEFSEVEAGGRSGFRVVHLLDWADPFVIEAYRDSTVTMSTFVQVTVTPPDTVVGIRRMDGYMVYASSVMPEDSLRSLMSRLVVGERPPN